MTKTYSISDARQTLAALIRSLATEERIEITRHGKPVATLLSPSAFERLAAPRRSFWQEYEAFRVEFRLEDLDVQPEIFTEGRDRSAGREVKF